MLKERHGYLGMMLALGLTGACGPQAVAAVPAEVIDMTAVADRSPARPSCPGAEGIAGDLLLCADFSQIASLDDPALGNWNFHVVPGLDCWQLSNATLANKNVPDIDSACAATLPALDLTAPAYAGYSRLTLSIQYDIDVAPQQRFDVCLMNSSNSDSGQIFIQSGSDIPVRQLILPVDKRDLPAPLNHVYKPQLRLSSPAKGFTTRGLMIHALAIIGTD